jgi:hypothetical protein
MAVGAPEPDSAEGTPVCAGAEVLVPAGLTRAEATAPSGAQAFGREGWDSRPAPRWCVRALVDGRVA